MSKTSSKVRSLFPADEALAGSESGTSPHFSATVPLVNILIVDDEPKNLSVLETVLGDPGYRLVRAGTGSEALLAMMAEEFAVLVLDVQMPDMTGFELAQIIKQRRKTARVPIIFLTAYYNEDQHVVEGYTSGAVDYLHKPVNAAVLKSKVSVFAELYRNERALGLANIALVQEVSERRLAEAKLNELNATLEKRVADRTSELRHSEALLKEAHLRKDEFLATLAHELRNPLAPIRQAVQVLRMVNMEAEKLNWAAQMIDRQVHAMSHLIDDLMDVGRINQGKIELRLAKVDLGEVLKEAIDTSRPNIEEGRHRLTVSIPAKPIYVDADPIRLAQVFLNLLNNAAKYMDPEGAVHIDAIEVDQKVAISVTDDGIGIEKGRLESIFTMFSQVETALSRSRGGLGIGLSLTQRLVQLHGGTVQASSQGLGHGSRFTVTLPLSASSFQEMIRLPSPDIPSAHPSPGEVVRILVADDNRDSAEALAMFLDCMGCVVQQAHDGEAAVVMCRDFDPHLVLLDIGMPKLNGYEACRAIRSQPGGEARSMVAITGWGQPDDRMRAENAGFDRHLVKPVDPELLLQLLTSLSENANARLSR